MNTAHLLRAATLALSVCATAIAAEPVDVRLTITQEAAGPRIEPSSPNGVVARCKVRDVHPLGPV